MSASFQWMMVESGETRFCQGELICRMYGVLALISLCVFWTNICTGFVWGERSKGCWSARAFHVMFDSVLLNLIRFKELKGG
jgi:hypothetical protein